ncbi:MAG: PIN domain-containing protein [Nocardioidaceae bacterium]
MIALDTNLLVYAHREDSPLHGAARAALAGLPAAGRAWGVPWPSVHEFLAIVTHPRIYRPPTPAATASRAVAELLGLPHATTLGETPTHLGLLTELLARPGVVGPKVHDARIAAICLGHGVEELWTADRDFSYFPELRTRNPLV